jgi:hypothetical protein
MKRNYRLLNLILVESKTIDIVAKTPTIPVNVQNLISKLLIKPNFTSMEIQLETVLLAKLLPPIIA